MRLMPIIPRSPLAIRLLVVIAMCAVLPSMACIVASILLQSSRLDADAAERLHAQSHILGRVIHDRLLRLDGELQRVADRVRSKSGAKVGPGEAASFRVMAVDREGRRRPRVIHGELGAGLAVGRDDIDRLEEGKTLLRVGSSAGSADPARLVLATVLSAGKPRRVLIGEVELDRIWSLGGERVVSPPLDVGLVDASGRVALASRRAPDADGEPFATRLAQQPSDVRWRIADVEHLAAMATVALDPRFSPSSCTVVVSAPRHELHAAAGPGALALSGIGLVTVLIALALGAVAIRRCLGPLQKILETSDRVAGWDFDARAEVGSGDELDDLAKSFNVIASRLNKQFHTLTTMAEIHRSILGSLDTDSVVETVLTRTRDVLPCDCLSVTLLSGTAKERADVFVASFDQGFEKTTESARITDAEMEKLYECSEYTELTRDDELPDFVRPLASRGCKRFLVLPIVLLGRLTGAITLGQRKGTEHPAEDLALVRQFADQVTLALSKSRLIEQLDQLHLGTLTAFARAIDAKSPWTAGHSERVTKLAVKIGRDMGLSQVDLERLNRGGLVHDIGKIGVPPEILDKPGRLTDEEFELMRQHTLLGARILEPIPAYADVIPIVLYHHERFDGKGYPHGLAGEKIDRNARILAVADCFDAMKSDRPYREGMPLGQVLSIIDKGAGTQFDPEAVKALMRVIERELEHRERKREREEAVG